ncbi:efflux RND transporter permease subunit [Persicobacter sp. CCB-QB2]|uniref:efflux RND transporter permease subunit n=1 Tax=Persicobacter sp. CCB-QB2 TaxID=1561025 RepID=UPI00092F6568|nr:efflux RND transporter permease subunit [Persicobacter sp. CCB-QB2]
MKSIISYFIKFPLAVNLVMVLIFVFGLVSLSGIQRNFFPNFPNYNIYVDVLYPGASPEEIEEGATLKIEEEVKGISNMERVTSVSSENSGKVTIEMERGTDMDKALTDVKNAVEKIASFPTGVESVVAYKHDNVNFAVNFTVTPKGDQSVSLKYLKQEAQKMEHDLLKIQGISKVDLAGYPEEEIGVLLDEEAMEAYNLTFQEVSMAVSAANLIMTGGTIKDGEEEFFIRMRNKSYESMGLEDIVVRHTAAGGVIRLSDVATIKDQWEDTPSKVMYNGKPAFLVIINTTFEEDVVQASDIVKEYIADYNARQDVLEAALNKDMSTILQQRIDLLVDNGLMGIILVLIFLSLFLNPRIAFWVAVGIPFSMMGMFILIPATSVTINMMSLFAMILVLGILVDDAIVVAENIYRHWQMGKPPVKAAIDGTLEVSPAVVSGVITTMLAFSAFMFVDATMGDMFSEVAIIVISILFVSLIEGLIILPAHVAHSKALKQGEKTAWQKYMGWAERGLLKFRDKVYVPIFRKSIEYKSVTFAIFTAMFIISIGMVANRIVGSTFFPEVEGDDFTIELTMPRGTEEAVTQQYLDKIMHAIWEVNDELRDAQPGQQDMVQDVFQRFLSSGSQASMQITLLDAEQRNGAASDVIQRIRDKVGDIPGAEGLTYESFSPFGKAVAISLVGDDNEVLQQAKEDLKIGLRAMPELTDISDITPIGNREFEIELKEKAHYLGVTVQEVISQIRDGFFGREAQRLQRGKDEVKVWVKYPEENRRDLGQLEDMKIRLADGSAYPLSELATIKMVNGVANIRHLEYDREVQLQANQVDPKASLPDIMKKMQKEVLQPILAQYPGVTADFDGQQREMVKTVNSIKFVLPIVLVLMFAMVVLTLRSVSQSVLVYAMIPLAFIGVVFGHWFHGFSVSMMSGMGMIALVGVMINDGLVLINAMNINLKEGMPYKEALIEAGISRFRPIMLTTLTTVVGMAPMVFETSLQAQFLIPVALSLAYGMILATTTTLLLLPAMLLVVNQLKVKIASLREGRTVSNEEVESAIKEMEYEYED